MNPCVCIPNWLIRWSVHFDIRVKRMHIFGTAITHEPVDFVAK